MREQTDTAMPVTSAAPVTLPSQRTGGPRARLAPPLVPSDRRQLTQMLAPVATQARLRSRRHARIGLTAVVAGVLILDLAVVALRAGYDAKPGAVGFTAALVGLAVSLASGVLAHAWEDRRAAALADGVIASASGGVSTPSTSARVHRLPAGTGLRRGYVALEVDGRFSVVRCDADGDTHHLPEHCDAAVLGWPVRGRGVIVFTRDLAPFAGSVGRFHRMMPRAARAEWRRWVAARRRVTN